VSATASLLSIRGPFGPPDGARADFEEIRRTFVDFSGYAAHEDLVRPGNDHSTRLIVGKKGVGKTVYLRYFQVNADQNDSLYATNVSHTPPATEDVVRICSFYDRPALAAEAWGWIWRRAIMRALVSHLLWIPELRSHMTPQQVKALTRTYEDRLGDLNKPHSVYEEAMSTAVEAMSKDSLRLELRHRQWSDIEVLLGEILSEMPPIFFYLDSFDEHFGNAPMYWLQCQKGLCLQVLDLYQDRRFDRLHVVVSVRDLVYSSLLHGQHATKYSGTPHIRVLDWDYEAIRHFLHEKCRQLPPEFRMDPDRKGVPGWLGKEEIVNQARGIYENLEEYLLRHTRQIPRDVVQLGNELCMRVEQAKAKGETELSDQAIRGAVATASRRFAEEQIAICANHLASDSMPSEAGRETIADYYMSEMYADNVRDELCSFIAQVGTDRFPLDKLKEALAQAGGIHLSSHQRPLDVLWMNGLLGYDDPDDPQERSHFYGARDMPDFNFRDDVEWYVFHPIVGHKVNIKPTGPRVRPFG
jgi:hypothetical protein